MRNRFTTGLALLALLTFAPAVSAQNWEEVGDAGELPGTAQLTLGVGPLTAISGEISSNTDADMYQIFLTGGATFSASTVGQPGTLSDTQLFLLDAAGFAVYANDDESPFTDRSTLPAGHLLTPTTAGLYFLVITGWNRDPVTSGGAVIFPSVPGGPVVGPSTAGSTQPINGYDRLSSFTGSYTIALTGAEFAAIPEPGTLWLVAVAAAPGVGLALRRLRRRA